MAIEVGEVVEEEGEVVEEVVEEEGEVVEEVVERVMEVVVIEVEKAMVEREREEEVEGEVEEH